MDEFKILASETFPNLPHAPIIEAVIDFRVNATAKWELAPLRAMLEEMLPDYPTVGIQNTWQTDIKIPFPGQPIQSEQRDIAVGLQFKSEHQIATFHPEGFTFSRLKPYQNWEKLQDEAFRLWRIHQRIANPSTVQRIGLRYINRFEIPPDERIEDYLDPFPAPPHGLALPHAGFLHVDTLTTPGYPYTVNVTHTTQQSQQSGVLGLALILDIDVFTSRLVGAGDTEGLLALLAQMRWLKNKAFFGSMTEKALNLFG
jgi:uncharacterized protein (TIGR04255 family)